MKKNKKEKPPFFLFLTGILIIVAFIFAVFSSVWALVFLSLSGLSMGLHAIELIDYYHGEEKQETSS
jgi:hypothetical protein